MEMIHQTQKGYAMAAADPSAVAAAETARAVIESAYVMAFRKPRNEDAARVAILNSFRRHDLAEEAIYSKPVGGSKIQGPSIRCAETCLQKWGNVRTVTQILYEDDNVRRINVSTTDLETNTTFGKDISIRKTVERRNKEDREVIGERKNTKGDTVYIVKATEDELANKEGSAISKVIRNEGLRLIPSDIVKEAVKVARQTLASKDSVDPAKAKRDVIDAFARVGVNPQDIEKYIGHPLAQLVPAELQELREIYASLKDGEMKWSDLFDEPVTPVGEKAPEVSNAKVAEKSKEKLGKLKEKMLKKEDAPAETKEPSEPHPADAIEAEAPWNDNEKAVEVSEEKPPIETKAAKNRLNNLNMAGM